MAVIEPPVYECVTRRSAFLRLWLIGVLGALVAASEPLPADLLLSARFSEFAFRLVGFVNTSLLLAVLVGLGTVAAREVGLYSVLAPQVPHRGRPRGLAFHWVQAAILVSIALVTCHVLFDFGFWHFVPRDRAFVLHQAARLSAANPTTQVLFHALTEELMLRWGLMSGLLWVLALLFRQPLRTRPKALLAWTAILGVSVLYLIGQMPAILSVLHSDPAGILLVRAMVASAGAGIVFGWLYWKHGLESAVLAHVLVQLGAMAFDGLDLV